jgi:hypothetical protein
MTWTSSQKAGLVWADNCWTKQITSRKINTTTFFMTPDSFKQISKIVFKDNTLHALQGKPWSQIPCLTGRQTLQSS